MSTPPPRICQERFLYADGSVWQCRLPFDGSFHENGHEYTFQLSEPVKSQGPVSRPNHYTDLTPEPIVVIQNWKLNFTLGNVVKYVARAGRKGNALEDLVKAKQYLEFEIAEREKLSAS